MHSRDFACSVVFCIIHHLFLLANLHDVDASAYVGRMPYEHVRLEGGHQFVAGTVFQGDVHRYIIRKGLVLERLDRLVMLDDFGLFHIFRLDVFFQLVIFATGQVETFHSESVDGLTIVVDTAILLYIHAWQLFSTSFSELSRSLAKRVRSKDMVSRPVMREPFTCTSFRTKLLKPY